MKSTRRNHLPPWILLVAFAICLPGKLSCAAASGHVESTYGKLSLTFEQNHGQAGEGVDFVARNPGYVIALSANAAAFRLRESEPGAAVTDLRMTLIGADACAMSEALEPLPGKANYFIGNDPAKWRTAVPTFARVRYAAVYPGIDIEYYGNQRQLEYDFRIAPGADWRQLLLEFAGAQSITIENETGDLLIVVRGKIVRQRRPFVYQEVNGQRQEVASSYALRGGNKVGFSIAEYDPERPLVIDPVLVYSTYLGGAGGDVGNAIAVDASGNVYIAGDTTSTDFPTTSGAFDTTYNGSKIAFVSKLNADGTALVYSTYLGGSINSGTGNPTNTQENAFGIAVDASGNAYVTGATFSSDFPTTAGAFDTTHNSPGRFDAFVTKLNPDGSALVYSTYLGGIFNDTAFGIAVDSSGNAYVTCQADAGFPTTAGAYQTSYGTGFDATATKLNADGSALIYSTFLGGAGFDQGIGIAVDGSGNAYVTGQADGASFPTTAGAFDTTANGARDPFVTKLNATGTALIYSTFLGGTSFDRGEEIVVDSSGNAYVAGQTDSTNFPTTTGAFDVTHNGSRDGFVTKLNADGTALVYSTYLGGSTPGFEKVNAIAVDSAGNAYVAGETPSADFPTTPDAIDTTHNGNSDVFFTQLNADGTALVYSTFLGASSFEQGFGIAVDSSGNAFVTGGTSSSDFPTTTGAFDTSHNGGGDAFVAKIGQLSAPTTYIVNTTTDTNDGVCDTAHCSLREAILAANANAGMDAIVFNIPGAGVQTINVGSTGLGALPAITDPVDINGYSQPGSAVNTATDGSTNAVLLIELNGQSTGFSGIDFRPGSDGSGLRGLVINRFVSTGHGILVGASNVSVGGCFIGTDPTGTAALPNGIGVRVRNLSPNTSGTRIGSSAPADRNVISGNISAGIEIGSLESAFNITDTEVSGNLIGINAQGMAALPNESGVIFAERNGGLVTDTRIGVPGEGGGNIISGNRLNGVEFVLEASNKLSGVRIRNNRIGTNAQGTAAVPNGSNPTNPSNNSRSGIYVELFANNVQIGGANAGEGNLISGNFNHGIRLLGSNSTTIQGNFIGTNHQGSTALPNGSDGVSVQSSSNNTIGGSPAGARNVISGNNDDGIDIIGGSGNIVQGNFIGTDSSGTADLGNDELGVAIGLGAVNNLIGGTVPGAGNVIAFNGEGGVFVSGDSRRNSILGNSIFSNTPLGINLFPHGVTPNDAGDADTGANDLQNFPALTSATSAGGHLTVQGILNSTPNTAFRVEFFSNPTCDSSGNGEGQVFLGSQDVTTDAGGNANVNATLTGQGGASGVVTATATDPNNNTSEFSPCVAIMTPAPTPTPTPTPTSIPTPTPVPSPTPASTATPTPSATVSPTPSPSPTTTPTPTPTPTPVARAAQLLNIATRLRVQTGENVLIGGFIITGNDPKKLMIRGIGPSLAQFFQGTLADPALQLFEGNTLLASNNDWRESEAEIAATGIPPTHDKESAIVFTLAPGLYTAVLQGHGGFTGIGVVEVYDLDQNTDSKLANIASRGFVETGDNVMIGGLIVGPADGTTAKVVVRAIGPSLGNFGIAGALQDPTLELVDANGVVLRANNDWQDAQQTEIENIGLQPGDTREAVLIETLAPGNYTAVVRGADNATQGVGLVEVYNIP